jgi:hypothetical protein
MFLESESSDKRSVTEENVEYTMEKGFQRLEDHQIQDLFGCHLACHLTL